MKKAGIAGLFCFIHGYHDLDPLGRCRDGGNADILVFALTDRMARIAQAAT